MMCRILAIALLILVQNTQCTISKTRPKGKMKKLSTIIPDQFCNLAKKYLLKCNKHKVITEDGYILSIYNIPGDRRRPIYLQHGFVDSSDTFIIRGNISLVASLAGEGYDVWLGNNRGNVHSRAHLYLAPGDRRFWDFSFHEIGMYDIPAIIDFILDKTGEKKLKAITHAEGSTAFFVMGATHKRYNSKVKLLICMAPVAFLHNAQSPLLGLLEDVSGHGEFMRNSSSLVSAIRVACLDKLAVYSVCINNFIVKIYERNNRKPEMEFWPASLKHYPAGSSIHNARHFRQLAARRQFAPYDYGSAKNMAKYNSFQPPPYKLNRVTMKTALMVGQADKHSKAEDVMILKRMLPNVVDYHVMRAKDWRHLDFVWGMYLHVYLLEYIYEMLDKYA